MLLKKDNFIVKMIVLKNDNTLTSENISDSFEGFTSNNSSPILGSENMKYKIMFSNISFPKDAKFIIFQISLLVNDEYYNPYLFLPINCNDSSNSQEGPGRALSFRIFKNNFDYIWMYFTRSSIEKILTEFKANDEIINQNEYIQEYIQLSISK